MTDPKKTVIVAGMIRNGVITDATKRTHLPLEEYDSRRVVAVILPSGDGSVDIGTLAEASAEIDTFLSALARESVSTPAVDSEASRRGARSAGSTKEAA